MALTDTAIVRQRLLGWLGSVVGDGEGDGDWEIEGLVLKATAPIRTPATPVMISFCIKKRAILTGFRMPLSINLVLSCRYSGSTSA
jgi:hypothetical protein